MTDAHEDKTADPDRDKDGEIGPLLTPEIRARIPDLYVTENLADPLVHAKLFSPWSGWTWYITEFDEVDQIGFGLACGQEVRFGYFDLKTLERIRGPNGLRIKRDRSFYPRPLSLIREALDRARNNRAPEVQHPPESRHRQSLSSHPHNVVYGIQGGIRAHLLNSVGQAQAVVFSRVPSGWPGRLSALQGLS